MPDSKKSYFKFANLEVWNLNVSVKWWLIKGSSLLSKHDNIDLISICSFEGVSSVVS